MAAALGLAELERRQAVAVQRDVDVGRVGVEALADHQARLAVRVVARAGKATSAASDRSPEACFQTKWNASAGEPHVLAAAGDGVSLAAASKATEPGWSTGPTSAWSEDADRNRRGLRRNFQRRDPNQKRNADDN